MQWKNKSNIWKIQDPNNDIQRLKKEKVGWN